MNKNLITPAVPNQDSQDMDDLRIVEYLNLATLPEPLQKMLSQAATPAELIGSKLILHMAAAYRLINGDTTELVPSIQTTCPKQLLFTSLQPEFAHQSLVESAKAHGIPKSTVLRWTTQWVDDGKLIRISHGIFKKIG